MIVVELEDDLAAAIPRMHPDETLEHALARVVGTGLKVIEAMRVGERVLIEKTGGRMVELVPRWCPGGAERWRPSSSCRWPPRSATPGG